MPFANHNCRAAPGGPPRYEWIGGALRKEPSPTSFHQDIACDLLAMLRTWARSAGAGKVFAAPLDVHLSRHDVVQPDILYITKARLPIIREDGIHGAPDLVVEIFSPLTTRRNPAKRIALYRQAGAKEAWLLEILSRHLVIYDFSAGAAHPVRVLSGSQRIASAVLPGFDAKVAAIFSCGLVCARDGQPAG